MTTLGIGENKNGNSTDDNFQLVNRVQLFLLRALINFNFLHISKINVCQFNAILFGKIYLFVVTYVSVNYSPSQV